MENDFKQNSCENSFLKETENNSCVGSEIRRDIDRKYMKSKVNAFYVFPRKVLNQQKTKIFFNKPSIIAKPAALRREYSGIVNAVANDHRRLPSLNNKTLLHYPTAFTIGQQHKRDVSNTTFLPENLKKSPYLSIKTIANKGALMKRIIFYAQ